MRISAVLESARGATRQRKGDSLIRIRRLRLTNFRNYAALDLPIETGTTVIEGANGHGKTNLLESIYLMSIGRSPRTSTDREMVRKEALGEYQPHTQIVAEVETAAGEVSLQIDLSARRAAGGAARVSKTFRVNGVARRSAEFVGVLKAVLFAAEDIHLTSGPPSARRRYMDILVSQMGRAYLRDVQEYQKLVTQRNHLLKSVRRRHSAAAELEFWEARMAQRAARIMDARVEAIGALSEAARPIHRELSGSDQPMSLTYSPSAEVGEYEDVRALSRLILGAIQRHREREIAAGFCLIGPHRDDIKVSIGDMDAGAYASRGQARTVTLAMKLGEAQLLADACGEQPVILLDDVVSELDPARGRHVLDRAASYEQTLMTTAEPTMASAFGSRAVNRICVSSGSAAAVRGRADREGQ